MSRFSVDSSGGGLVDPGRIMGISIEDLESRARDLVSVLAARAEMADRSRSVSDDTIRLLGEAGLFSTMAPAEHGGLELGLEALTRVTRTVARGCASTAWLVAFYGVHNWLLALYPRAVRKLVLEPSGYALAPAVFAPTGTATRADGAWRVSGRWAWGTGIEHGRWVMVNALAEVDGRPDALLCLLPAACVEEADVWHTAGMRGTRSNDIVIEGAVVEDEYAIGFRDVLKGTAPGAADLAGRIFRYPIGPVLTLAAASVAVGLGTAMLDLVTERAKGRTLAYTAGRVQRDEVGAQIRFGTARARVDAATALFDREVRSLEDRYARGETWDVADRAHARLVGAHCVGESRRVVAALMEASGASAHHLSCPLQRMQRDVNTLSGHVVFDEDAAAELEGKSMLGVDLPPLALV